MMLKIIEPFDLNAYLPDNLIRFLNFFNNNSSCTHRTLFIISCFDSFGCSELLRTLVLMWQHFFAYESHSNTFERKQEYPFRIRSNRFARTNVGYGRKQE